MSGSSSAHLDSLYSRMLMETNSEIKQRLYNSWLAQTQSNNTNSNCYCSPLCISTGSGGLYSSSISSSRCWGSADSIGFGGFIASMTPIRNN